MIVTTIYLTWNYKWLFILIPTMSLPTGILNTKSKLDLYHLDTDDMQRVHQP